MKKGFSRFVETVLCTLVIAASVAFVAVGYAHAASEDDKAKNICDVSGERADIISLTESGIMPLYDRMGEYYFYPDRFVTREYIASAAARAYGLNAKKYTSTGLGTADENDIEPLWLGYVRAAAFEGIITVYSVKSDGQEVLLFRPNEYVTRAEAAKILSAIVYATVSTSKTDEFSDVNEIPSDCRSAVEKMVALGIMAGDEGNFRPNDFITNGELAAALYKIVHGGYIKK